MKVDDIIVLSGKTRHGKNRVREQGELWKVVRISTGLPHTRFPSGTPIVELETLDKKHWRIVSLSGDTDFDFRAS